MFCTKCGNQLPDGTKFCTKCGAPTSPEFAVSDMPAADGLPVNAPMRSKKTPIIIAIAAIIIVFGGAAAFGAKFTPGLFKKLFTPTDEYFRYIVSENISGGLDEILGLYENTEDLANLSSSGSISLTLDDAGRRFLYGLEPMLDDYIGSIDSAAINFSVNSDGNLFGIKYGFQLGDTDITDAELVMDRDDIYINMPDLSDTPFYMSADDTGLGELPNFSEILDNYPDADVLKALSKRYVDIALGAIPSSNIEKTKKTAEVNGILQECDYYNVTVTSSAAKEIAAAVLTEARDDNELKDTVSDFVALIDPYTDKAEASEDFTYEINSALDDISDLSDYGNNSFECGFYVNKLGKIVGMELTPDEENSFKIVSAQQSDNYSFTVSLINYGAEAFTLSGSGKKNGGAFTGNISFMTDGSEYLTASIDNFSYKNGFMSGSGTISLGADAARIIRNEIDSSVAAFLPIMDFALAFDFKNSAKNSSSELSLTQNGEKLATVSLSAENSSDYVVSIPSGAAHIDDIEDYISLSKIKGIIEKLRTAGVPSEICDALLYELY